MKRRFKMKKVYIGFGIFVIAFIVFIIVWGNLERKKEAEREEVEIAEQAELEQKKDEERQRIYQYNVDHKEEHYQKAIALIEEKEYNLAKEFLGKVLAVDEEYEDAKKLVQDIDEKAAKVKRVPEEKGGLK